MRLRASDGRTRLHPDLAEHRARRVPSGRGPRGTGRTERTTTNVTLNLSPELTDRPSPAWPAPVPMLRAGRPHPVTERAARRDLARLQDVLAEPITAVRRAALAAHIGFLVEQVRSDAQPGPRGAALSRLRHEARLWSREPDRRPALRDVARSAAATFTAGPDGSAGRPEGADGNRTVVRLRELPARRPTALAYRYFWLLDDLPPNLADAVTHGYSRSARWVLRNLLSGGYNRRAYLMWIGGGSGPAI